MRCFPPFALLALGLVACAPPPRPVTAPVPTTEIVLAGGPDGESPVPGSGLPAVSVTPAPNTATLRLAAAVERLSQRDLVIPVAGVAPSRIENTFTEGRDGGERQHNAVDILAPRNTPILAADDGSILRLSTNTLGGITIYASDATQEFVYYYAHLDHYRKGLSVGQHIQKGDTLGFVGTTGNAPKDTPHLHFQIMIWAADGKWWNGEPVNPYPILRRTWALPSTGGR